LLAPLEGRAENRPNDFSPAQIRMIGIVELLAVLGLVLPALLNILPILTPLAGLGLILTMAGAALTHIRRREIPMILPNVVLGALAAFVAYGYFVLIPLQ
jgi:hypothetical protein